MGFCYSGGIYRLWLLGTCFYTLKSVGHNSIEDAHRSLKVVEFFLIFSRPEMSLKIFESTWNLSFISHTVRSLSGIIHQTVVGCAASLVAVTWPDFHWLLISSITVWLVTTFLEIVGHCCYVETFKLAIYCQSVVLEYHKRNSESLEFYFLKHNCYLSPAGP